MSTFNLKNPEVLKLSKEYFKYFMEYIRSWNEKKLIDNLKNLW